MTTDELDAIEARAKAADRFELSDVPDDVCDDDHEFACPLCDSDGYVYGTVYDGEGAKASTVIAYGIGKDLTSAEEWVENGPGDTLRLVAEVRRLRALVPADA
jgi:hypothetical protein